MEAESELDRRMARDNEAVEELRKLLDAYQGDRTPENRTAYLQRSGRSQSRRTYRLYGIGSRVLGSSMTPKSGQSQLEHQIRLNPTTSGLRSS